MADHGPIEVWFSTRLGSAVYTFRTERHVDVTTNTARAFIQVGHLSLRHPIKSWRRARHAWQMVNAYVRAVERLNDPPHFKPSADSDAEADAFIDALTSDRGE